MADNQAEDDDDESFGDFKFASYPNQPFPSKQMNGRGFSADDDDDEWGDFSSNQINGGLDHSNGLFPSNSPPNRSGNSKLFDPFGFSVDRTEKPGVLANELSRVESATSTAGAEMPRSTKHRGALPLSIFGEEEEKEEEEPGAGNLTFDDGANVFSNRNGGSAKKGADSNGAMGINDLIADLYIQSPKINSENGSISNLSGPDLNFSGASSNGNNTISPIAAHNPIENGLNSNIIKFNSDSVGGNEDISDDNGGWEFKWAEPETQIKSGNIEVEETKHETAREVECTFKFDDGAHVTGDMVDSSSGIFHKAGKSNLEFEFSPNFVLQNCITPSQSVETKTGFTVFNEDFGEFMNAQSELGSNHNLEVPKMADIKPACVEVLKFNTEGPSDPKDPSLASREVSHQSYEWDFGFNFKPSSLGEDHHISASYSTSKQDGNNEGFNASPTNTNVDSDVNLFESKDAIAEIGTNHEKSQISSDERRGREALPLSIFGDEMPDTDDHSVYQDFSPYAKTSSIMNSFNSPVSKLSINDLIWSLYSQAEHKNSPNSTPKASEIGIHTTPALLGSSLVNRDDDFNDDSWEFKDASSGTRFGNESVQNTSSSHTPQVDENVFLPSSAMILNSELINGDYGFEDGFEEFKDAFSGTRSQDQASVVDHGDPTMQLSTKLDALDHVDFYCKLKDELHSSLLCHLQDLKKARSTAALSGEDAKAKVLEEIQELCDILHQDNIIPDDLSENHSPRNMFSDELLEALKEPKFLPLESEYQLRSRLSMAEKDTRSAIELMKHVVSTLKILKLRSREEQSNYLTMWSKIAFVCSQELKHGTLIWKQSVLKNVHDQILSSEKGFHYIHALGEIYRVAEIIGASVKLHKPWILLGSVDPTSLFALLNECYTIWSGSGLEEALLRLSNQTNVEQDGNLRELLESIKHIHELDEHALHSCVISGQETTCQLSGLPACFVPGLKMVTWNGKNCFLTLANLWVNLVSSDPPRE